MRKSRHVTTLLLGSALALTLTGCKEKEQDAKLFSDVTTCAANGTPMEECEAAYQAAQNAHANLAPRYATREECERDIGVDACQQMPVPADPSAAGTAVSNNGGSGFFMPMMAGFMLARMLDGSSSSRSYGRPIYADRKGYMYAGNDRLGRFGDCNPNSMGCGSRAGTGTFAGAPTFARDAKVKASTINSPEPAGLAGSARKSAGFGKTGSRASFSAGG